jgi:hypothetical protein
MAADAKPKPPPTLSRLAGDALVETIDGPVEIVKLVGKATPVMTRMPDGSIGFRMLREVRELEPEADLLELRNADGQVVRTGADHVFVRADGGEVRARDLRPGDQLRAGWTYPAGYVPPDAAEYAPRLRGKAWAAVVEIAASASAGRGPVFGFSVNQTKCCYLTFGALCRAQF